MLPNYRTSLKICSLYAIIHINSRFRKYRPKVKTGNNYIINLSFSTVRKVCLNFIDELNHNLMQQFSSVNIEII